MQMPAGLGFGLVVGVEERAFGDQHLGVLHVGMIEDGAGGRVAEERDQRHFERGTGSRRPLSCICASSGPVVPMYSGLSFSRMLMSE